jgi:hypothetical protein
MTEQELIKRLEQLARQKFGFLGGWDDDPGHCRVYLGISPEFADGLLARVDNGPTFGVCYDDNLGIFAAVFAGKTLKEAAERAFALASLFPDETVGQPSSDQ